jgi:hypothetical protein
MPSTLPQTTISNTIKVPKKMRKPEVLHIKKKAGFIRNKKTKSKYGQNLVFSQPAKYYLDDSKLFDFGVKTKNASKPPATTTFQKFSNLVKTNVNRFKKVRMPSLVSRVWKNGVKKTVAPTVKTKSRLLTVGTKIGNAFKSLVSKVTPRSSPKKSTPRSSSKPKARSTPIMIRTSPLTQPPQSIYDDPALLNDDDLFGSPVATRTVAPKPKTKKVSTPRKYNLRNRTIF